MANLGSASLILNANASGLDRGLNQAQNRVSAFVTNISGNISFAAGGWVGALVAGFRGVFDALGSVMERVDNATKEARSLGIATDTFMGLQHAANLSGISAEDFGKSMRKLVNRVAEARAGSVEARAAFARLGMTLDDLGGVDVAVNVDSRRLADDLERVARERTTTIDLSLIPGRTPETLDAIAADRTAVIDAALEPGRTAEGLDRLARERTASIDAALEPGRTDETLDHIARDRTAFFDTFLDSGRTAADLEEMTRDRTARVTVEVEAPAARSTEEIFMQVADRLNAIEDPVMRMRAAVDLFGRDAGRLLPMFEQGADGIRQAVDEARRLGIALSDADASSIEEANDAMTRVKESINGILMQIAVALAPVLTQVSTVLTAVVNAVLPIVQQLIAAFQPIGEALLTLFTTVVQQLSPIIQGIANAFQIVADIVTPIIEIIMATIQLLIDIFSPLIEAIQSVSPPFETIGSVVRSVLLVIVTGFRLVTEVVAGFVRFMASIPLIGRAFRGASAGLDRFVARVRESEDSLRRPRESSTSSSSGGRRTGGDGTGRAELAGDIAKAEADLRKSISTFGMSRDEIQLWELAQRGASEAALANIRALQRQRRELETAAAVRKVTDDLNKQIATFGMSRDEIQLWELAQQGANARQLETVRALQETRNAMEENRRVMEEGRQLTESMKTPTEKFQDEMDRLQRLLDRGAISWETYERAATRALQDVAKENEQLEIKTPSAMVAGSRDAVETIIRANMAGMQDNSREGIMNRIMTEQREYQRQGVEIARETLRVMRSRDPATVV
jgi:hypothetical protein